jgi:cupin fold WbuC family metalloprotein
MLNAVEPESYVRPHRHVDPDKPEAFVALRGSALVVRFDDNGAPVEGILVDAEGPVRGAEVPPGAWHMFLALRSGTVLFEVTQGPYDAAAHKQFAPWAPEEADTRAAAAYVAELRGHFEALVPQIAALDQIAAEEDDIC